MTVREAAARLEVSPSLVYRLVESGRLRCTRHGLGRGVIRISDAQLADYLAAAERDGTTGTAATPGPIARPARLRHQGL